MKYLLIMQVETDRPFLGSAEQDDLQERITRDVIESCILNGPDYEVTHVFDLQPMPEDE